MSLTAFISCRDGVLDSMFCSYGWTTRSCDRCGTYSRVGWYFNQKYPKKCSCFISERWISFGSRCWYVLITSGFVFFYLIYIPRIPSTVVWQQMVILGNNYPASNILTCVITIFRVKIPPPVWLQVNLTWVWIAKTRYSQLGNLLPFFFVCKRWIDMGTLCKYSYFRPLAHKLLSS